MAQQAGTTVTECSLTSCCYYYHCYYTTTTTATTAAAATATTTAAAVAAATTTTTTAATAAATAATTKCHLRKTTTGAGIEPGKTTCQAGVSTATPLSSWVRLLPPIPRPLPRHHQEDCAGQSGHDN